MVALPASSTVVLADNGSDLKTITANGSFMFSTSVASGATYAVTVHTQPAEQCLRDLGQRHGDQ